MSESEKSDDRQSSGDAGQKGDHEKEKGEDQKGEKEPDKKESQEQKPKKPPIYKKPGFIIAVSIVIIVLLIGGIIAWLILRQYVSTDDAYIDGHTIQISPQIAARVAALHIDDNQFVHKGDLLIELDPTDYQVALQQQQAAVTAAKGRLEQARAQVGSSQAAIAQAHAQEHATQSSLVNATRDLERYQKVDARARSQQQLDNASTAQTNAQAQLEQSQAQVATAEANLTTSLAAVKAAEGDVQTAEANQKRAEVNLSYFKIFAPDDGRITERTVEAGNYASTGQALCLIVNPNVWVTANFKETQLTRMQPGQPVTIKVDAFPKQKLHGHVDSIQAGSGSRFSVLPAENATGNFVKVVQRVPVKIVFEHEANTNDAPMLSPGLSVISRVKVR